MKRTYYLAVDIGASSGRHMLAHLEDGKIVLEEIHRFENGMDEVHGHKIWDVERLYQEVLKGMKKCKDQGKMPVSMGIDTWAVDYVLLDEKDRCIGPCYAYRDSRTEGIEDKVYDLLSEEELYRRTGIQRASFNTIYQLMAMKMQNPAALAKASTMLMIPDYLHFRLTGVKCQEYTNASTTQLVHAETKEWDRELIDRLGLPQEIFGEIAMPGTVLGDLRPETQEVVGYNCKVVLPATHDTGSAVMSVPSNTEDTLYISSGTWSLLGSELNEANCTKEAAKANFTNEGGYDHRYRFLKNIMGLWMIQSVRKEFQAGYEFVGKRGDEDYSFGNLCQQAANAGINSVVNANDSRFLAPNSMIDEVKAACRESSQLVPETPWEISRVIYRSLAICYKEAIDELEQIVGKHYDTIHVVGGGSKAIWLNQLTAQETGRVVMAGPGEATAIGNIGAQLIANGVYEDLTAFRKGVAQSFPLECFSPDNSEQHK